MIETLTVSIQLEELPEDVRRRLNQDALRTGKPVTEVIKEWLLMMSQRMSKTTA